MFSMKAGGKNESGRQDLMDPAKLSTLGSAQIGCFGFA
jgi:hypothetical protein